MPYKDKQQQAEWFKDRRKEIRRIVEAAKSVPCLDCGIQYPPHVMQFDHVRGEKCLNIGSATARVKNLDALREEIAKCDVVCANCHAERTHSRLMDGTTVLVP